MLRARQTKHLIEAPKTRGGKSCPHNILNRALDRNKSSPHLLRNNVARWGFNSAG
jgi:hypothetical protein